MSKERARRREERQREAAIRTAARAAEQERRERRAARQRAFRSMTTDRLPGFSAVGRPTGVLARRQRTRTSLLLAALVCANILVWVVRPDWEARLGALVVSALAFPVLRLFLVSRR